MIERNNEKNTTKGLGILVGQFSEFIFHDFILKILNDRRNNSPIFSRAGKKNKKNKKKNNENKKNKNNFEQKKNCKRKKKQIPPGG